MLPCAAAGCHGHHGQIPAGEYLVATAAHTRGTDGAPRFLPWVEFLDMCLQLQLPVNDTWLIAGQQQAADARQLLDDVSLAPRGTGDILQQLNQLTDGGAAGSSSSSDGHGVHSIHLPGTYPHDQWQGSRLEGFVIAQGQPISGDTHQQLQLLQGRMAQQVIQLDVTPQQLRQPYAQLVAKAGEPVRAAAACALLDKQLQLPGSTTQCPMQGPPVPWLQPCHVPLLCTSIHPYTTC